MCVNEFVDSVIDWRPVCSPVTPERLQPPHTTLNPEVGMDGWMDVTLFSSLMTELKSLTKGPSTTAASPACCIDNHTLIVAN